MSLSTNPTQPSISEWSPDTLKNWPELTKPATKGTVLLLLTSSNPAIYPDGKRTGFHFYEALMPLEEFLKSGYTVLMVSETGQALPDENFLQPKYAEAYALKVYKDLTHPMHTLLKNMHKAEALLPMIGAVNGLYSAGGHGCPYDLPKAKNVRLLISQLYERGAVIGLDCHAPSVLDGLLLSNGSPLVSGKKATGFSTSLEEKTIPGILKDWSASGIKTIEETIKSNGGQWSESSNPMGEYVMVDGRLVTGMNPASAKKLAQEMVIILDKQMQTGGTVNYDKILHPGQLSGSQSTKLRFEQGDTLKHNNFGTGFESNAQIR